VERVVLNALAKRAALPPDICAFGDSFPIDFGEIDPPWHTCAHEDIAASTAASTVDGAPTIAGGDTSLRDVPTVHLSPITSLLMVSAAESDALSATARSSAWVLAVE